MITNLWYGLMFLAALVCQTAVISAWPEPFRFFPLTLVLGVIILHERSLVLGVIWISLAGAILEARGLGSGLAIGSLVAALAAAGLALSVFAKRSFWALLGVGVGSALAFTLCRAGVIVFLAAFREQSLMFGRVLEQGLWVFVLAVIGVIIFGAYLRRLLTWSRDKFVSRGQLYDISFPQ